MKNFKVSLDQSEGFVLGIAIDENTVQLGLIAWIFTLKF